MAIDWSHLPPEVIKSVCMCIGKKAGYSHEPATGYYVCALCRKPSVLNAVAECDICEKVFVPKEFIPNHIKDLGVMCPECWS